MQREKILFESETPMMRQDAVTFLHDLADRLVDGQLTLRRGSESVTIEVPARVTLELKAEEASKRRGVKHTFEIELEWMEWETAVNEPVLLD